MAVCREPLTAALAPPALSKLVQAPRVASGSPASAAAGRLWRSGGSFRTDAGTGGSGRTSATRRSTSRLLKWGAASSQAARQREVHLPCRPVYHRLFRAARNGHHTPRAPSRSGHPSGRGDRQPRCRQARAGRVVVATRFTCRSEPVKLSTVFSRSAPVIAARPAHRTASPLTCVGLASAAKRPRRRPLQSRWSNASATADARQRTWRFVVSPRLPSDKEADAAPWLAGARPRTRTARQNTRWTGSGPVRRRT